LAEELSNRTANAQLEKLAVVKRFAEKAVGKYKDVVKCIVLFGETEVISESRRDIDVLVVLDDTSESLTKELESIEEDLEKIAEEVSGKLSLQIFNLTEFWDNARVGNPVMYNMIKTGKPAYDVGIFTPMQRLLNSGKIPITREQIVKLMEDVPEKIARAEAVKLLMLAEDCYYAMLNSAQATLMLLGIEPPPPHEADIEVRRHLVETGLLEDEYAEWLKGIIEIRKKIEWREMTEVTGSFVDEWIEKAKRFAHRMLELQTGIERLNKEKIIERTYEVILKAFRITLEEAKKLPEGEVEVPKIFKEEFVDKKLIDDHYWNTWQRIHTLKNFVDKKEMEEIDRTSYNEILHLREDVRRLIEKLAGVLKKNGEI
jgi:uncharacterized protein (UPF0332 family)